jgi:3-phenylpropionate/trans-cinnamate dioxygenase ferredoxin subunit
MAQFVTVAKAGEVAEGELESYEVAGTTVAVANVGGDLYAVDNTCTHQQCSLAEGDVDGFILTCPCHGSQFDVRTGEVHNPPATEPVRTYAVQVEGDEIRVEA